MGVMEKMRNSTGVVLWVLIFSFGILWMLQDTKVFNVLGAGPRSLGSVNGERIKNQEYQGLIQSYSNRYSRQTGNSATAEQRAYFQDQAWNELVTSKLLSQKMDKLGITVTDQEVVNMITGKHPDSFIRQQFAKKDGSIDRVALNQAIDSKKNSQVWIAIEQQLRQKRRRQKITNFVQSAMQVSQHEVQQQYILDNTTADVSFIRFPYADVAAKDVKVSDDDLQSYYNNHKDKFQQKESYRFAYVTFDKTPTKEDTTRTIKEVGDLRTDFAKTTDDSLFLSRYQSTTPYNDKFVDKKDVKELFQPVLPKLKKGEVSQVIKDKGQVYILKKVDEKGNQVKFLILSDQIKADPIATVDKRANDADDFRFFAKKNGFEKEAQRRNFSLHKGFATKGNAFIAGLGQSRQIMDMLGDADEGNISKPIELPGQFVVLKVTQKTPKGTRPFKEVKSQVKTIVLTNKRRQKVVDNVTAFLKSNNSLSTISTASGKKVQTTEGLAMNAETIEGAGREPEVIGAIFSLKAGELSKPIEGTSAVFVANVSSKKVADPKNIKPAEAQKIRQQLQQDKSRTFAQVWLKELKDKADVKDYRSEVLQGR